MISFNGFGKIEYEFATFNAFILLFCVFFLKDVIAELLDDLDKHHWCFFPVLQCLHVLTKNLPQHPLGKKVVNTTSC